ncbi:branched-chain amino acid ABC transporter substrate-binding protein [Aestuariimicrobium soli]|uniref:branched-chain amino acid ABC transporter substrate-binding protein n=1 Tax=Aestuariimicrobium soli TaxID=2035834 RepID=UPI003EBD8A61
MNRRSLLFGAVGISAAALGLSACGTRGETTGTSSGGSKKTAKIGVIAPLSGDLSAMGLGIRNSVELAIKQANAANAIPGWELVMAAEDDQATPDVGANAATKLSSDPDVIGVVGTLNSGVSQGVQPILDAKKIVQVSPANTGDYLTKGSDIANPKRPHANYFRVCTVDSIQGPFAAQYVFDSGIKKVAVVNDKKPYGQGLAAAFAAKFKELGGEVVGEETAVKQEDFGTVITSIKGKAPELVYYGTEYQLAGPFSRALKAAGLNVPVMGGDGIFDQQFIDKAGSTSNGDLATSVGAPVESLDSAKKYVSDYSAAGYKDGYSAYGAYAYDAANAIIEGLKTSLKDAADVAGARQATIDAVGKVSFDGATGKVGFDEFGDAVAKVLTVYKVTGGKWAPEKTGELG